MMDCSNSKTATIKVRYLEEKMNISKMVLEKVYPKKDLPFEITLSLRSDGTYLIWVNYSNNKEIGVEIVLPGDDTTTNCIDQCIFPSVSEFYGFICLDIYRLEQIC